MKKNTILFFGLTFSLGFSQNGLTVNNGTSIFIEKNVLFYSKGNLNIKASKIKNKGNFILKGDVSSFFKILNSDGSLSSYSDVANNGGAFINLLNNPNNYLQTNLSAKGENYSYGQLYINGIPQSNISAFVDVEHRNANHGAYQQIGLPFYNKNLSELNSELGKTFSNIRWSQNEILKYNNNTVVFDNLNISTPLTDATGYYILGNKSNSLDVSTITRTMRGIPFADDNSMIVTLQNAGNGINFGTNGTAINQYKERYNSYLQDGFEIQSALGGIAWQGNYGRNIYQFSNPFLTNIDLRNIFINESNGDGVFLSNIYGIRLEQGAGTISYTPNTGGGSTSFRYVTWDSNTNSPVGDVDWLIVRPFSVFVIKLKDNSAGQNINFNNLRRFNYTPRTNDTSYSVIASKSSQVGTIKQLGVIALDENQKEIGRTYYVVSPNAITGHSSNASLQISASSSNVLGTYEEKKDGGYDNDFISKYWLYINEANEVDFKGKAIPMVVYNSSVKSLKFEIRENSKIIPNGNSELTTGTSFYYSINSDFVKVKQDDIINIDTTNPINVNLYYGEASTLSNNEVVKTSRTFVVYNPEIQKYIIKFDSNWKKANIQIFDFSGRLIYETKNSLTNKDFIINNFLSSGTYLVKIVSEKNEIINSKILVK